MDVDVTRIQPNAYGLLETYVLGCIGCLPPDKEARLQHRHRRNGDWKTYLRHKVFHMDAAAEDRLRQRWDDYQKQAALQHAQPDAGQFVRLAIADECFARFLESHRVPEIPVVRLAPRVTVRAVGFWRGDEDPANDVYPSVHGLVRRGWHANELKEIIAYLKSGYQAHQFRFGGWSTCRFRPCGGPGGPGEFNGCDELTDGQWGWPQGLAHYIECHSVILPEEFVDTMRANNWRPPPLPDPPHPTTFDYSFWIEWSRRKPRRGIFRWWQRP